MRNSRYLQIIAYVMIIAIFVFFMGIVRNCSRLSYEPIEGYSGGDTLDIALIYVPGGYYVYGDSISGINAEISKQFSQATGTPVKTWAITDVAKGMDKLESGAFDILASLPLDNNLKKRFPVSESVFLDRLVLIQLSDSTSQAKLVNSSLDLKGKQVYVAAGSSASTRIRNLASEIGGDIEIIELPELSDELIALKVASGDLPLAVVNEKVARELAKSYPLLTYDNSVSFTQFQVWIFNPSDSTAYRNFNSWLDDFIKTTEYRDIISRY